MPDILKRLSLPKLIDTQSSKAIQSPQISRTTTQSLRQSCPKNMRFTERKAKSDGRKSAHLSASKSVPQNNWQNSTGLCKDLSANQSNLQKRSVKKD